MSDSLQPHELQPARLLCPCNFPDKSTGVGCHVLLQEIFLTQWLNMRLLCLLHWQVDSLPMCHRGSQHYRLLWSPITIKVENPSCLWPVSDPSLAWPLGLFLKVLSSFIHTLPAQLLGPDQQAGEEEGAVSCLWAAGAIRGLRSHLCFSICAFWCGTPFLQGSCDHFQRTVYPA